MMPTPTPIPGAPRYRPDGLAGARPPPGPHPDACERWAAAARLRARIPADPRRKLIPFPQPMRSGRSRCGG
jgi:hypothetical protein